ncbi:MAG: TonB-dependent receptor [Bacteroidales bacterium]|nr:TonB-dependent receptor [Candidatus Cryptobacteroides fimicaballi]
MKRISAIVTLLALAGQINMFSQQIDTTALYGERKDTLDAAAVSVGQGNYVSRLRDMKTEVISAAGLCKMACCNLAESFENSASVTVGYSDAVTGARQIRLLGLSGTYTQMLDENRPVMRGLASPFGLSYVPGQWLNSIQIAKGAPSVINGVESITGQINMEHRKPTDEIPLFINASFMSDTKADLNLASSLQLDREGKWSTAILGHVSGNFAGMDMNGDGFLDDPRQLQVNFANRWLYYNPDGVQVRFGVKFLRDKRNGGQVKSGEKYWHSKILNQAFNAYLKVGIPLNTDNTQNVALVADFNDYAMAGTFGKSVYDASQLSGFLNLLYQNQELENHHYTLGLSTTYDHFVELLNYYVPYNSYQSPNGGITTNLLSAGAFGEYTYHLEDKLSVIAGLRADYYRSDGRFRISPRLTVKYNPTENLVLRLNGGRGLRYACPLSDNIGVLSTGKEIYSSQMISHPLEDAWIAGGNVTWYLPFLEDSNAYLSFDYFRTQFVKQLLVDYHYYKIINNSWIPDRIGFYTSSDRSYTNTYQLDFSVEPVKRFTVTATFRYTDAKATYKSTGFGERFMTSRYKGVLNLQYATNLNKWIFDFTASINGPCRLYEFMDGEYSRPYPLLYAQVTHRMKGWDIYLGGENLTNFTQKNPIIKASDPWSPNFDASCIWGPLMGIRVYAGVRITLWKTN